MKIYIYLFLFCSFFSAHSQELNDIDLKEIPKEIENINSLILKEPSAENYYLRGYYYYQIKNYSEAIADYDKAISLNPNDYNFYYSIRKHSY